MNSLKLKDYPLDPTYKIVKNAKVSGNIRKTSWLYKRALKGFFSMVEKDNLEEARAFANQIDSMITVLNGVYGDRWDFDLRPKYGEDNNGEIKFFYFELFVEIYYPEIEISNSKGDKHLIKDLLVRFKIEKSDFNDKNGGPIWCVSNVEGTRATLSYEEWCAYYLHSHLPKHFIDTSYKVFDYGDFCLGSDTDIVNQIENLITEYSPENFEFFLWLINSTVAWESLEGVPYINMKKIGISENSRKVLIRVFPSLPSDSYVNYIKPKIERLDVDFIYNKSKFKIAQNKKFERLLHKIIVSNIPNYLDWLLIKKVGMNYYGYSFPKIISIEDIEESLKVDGEMPSYYFRDKEITFKILPLEKEVPDIESYKVHPKFMNYVATRIEQEIYENTIRKSAIERYHQSHHA